MELFIAAVVIVLMYGVHNINGELEKERKLTLKLRVKLHEAYTLQGMAQRKLDSIVIKARRDAGRDPSRL